MVLLQHGVGNKGPTANEKIIFLAESGPTPITHTRILGAEIAHNEAGMVLSVLKHSITCVE